VWGTALELDNIVWGTTGEVDNIVWGTSSEDTPTEMFDDPEVPSVFDGTVFDALFDGSAPDPSVTSEPTAPLAILPEDSLTTTVLAPVTTVLGGGL
jgi:hypothetical protein